MVLVTEIQVLFSKVIPVIKQLGLGGGPAIENGGYLEQQAALQ